MDIGIISKQLEHSSIATTARYLDHIAPLAVVEAIGRRPLLLAQPIPPAPPTVPERSGPHAWERSPRSKPPADEPSATARSDMLNSHDPLPDPDPVSYTYLCQVLPDHSAVSVPLDHAVFGSSPLLSTRLLILRLM